MEVSASPREKLKQTMISAPLPSSPGAQRATDLIFEAVPDLLLIQFILQQL